MSDSGLVTQLLNEVAQGNKNAIDQLLPLVYGELRRMAQAYFRHERGSHTLQATALVHEAYLRLADQRMPIEGRSHFLALAATQMRRILLDYARQRGAERRGGREERVLLDDTMAVCGQRPLDVITLDVALTELGRLDPSQAQLVELRFFGGLSVEETAEVMGVSTPTVKRNWRSARAFLHRHLRGITDDAGAMGASSSDI